MHAVQVEKYFMIASFAKLKLSVTSHFKCKYMDMVILCRRIEINIHVHDQMFSSNALQTFHELMIQTKN